MKMLRLAAILMTAILNLYVANVSCKNSPFACKVWCLYHNLINIGLYMKMAAILNGGHLEFLRG